MLTYYKWQTMNFDTSGWETQTNLFHIITFVYLQIVTNIDICNSDVLIKTTDLPQVADIK